MLQCVALLRERAAGVLRDVQARALWSRGSDAPRPAGVRRRLAIERPLTVPPKGLCPQAQNRRLRAVTRVDQGRRS